jgi:hypothetical protein
MGRIDIVLTLIDANADIEQMNDCGTSALHIASQSGHVETVRHLWKLGANLEGLNIKRRTPLISAIRRGQPEVVRLLLRSSASIGPNVWLEDALYAGEEMQKHTALWYHIKYYTPLCAACAAADHGAIGRLLPVASGRELLQAEFHAQDEESYNVARYIQRIRAAGSYEMYVRRTLSAHACLWTLVANDRAHVAPDINAWWEPQVVGNVCLRVDLEYYLIHLLKSIFTLELPIFINVVKFLL